MQNTAPDFTAPWVDLRDRLDRALDDLRALFRDARGDESLRLAWKRDAIESAYEAWDRINLRCLRGEIDTAEAWRAFADQVAYFYAVTDADPGFYEGVALALSYQRGYGPGIDAPVVTNPHLKHI